MGTSSVAEEVTATASLGLPPVNANTVRMGNGELEGMCAATDAERFRHRVDDLVSKADKLEQRVSDVVQFYGSKKQPGNLNPGNGGAKKQIDGFRKEGASTKRMQELMRQFGTILKQLSQHKWAWPFMEPVDPKRLRIADYYEVIKKPMDFRTIRNRMEAKDGSGYKHVREIYADVRLVFANAMTYNSERNDVHIMAKTLLDKLEEKWLLLLPKVIEEETRSKDEEAQDLANMQFAQEAAIAKMAKETNNELSELNMHLEELREMVVQKCRKISAYEKRKLGVELSFLSPEDLEKALEIVGEDNLNFQATTTAAEIDLDAQERSKMVREIDIAWTHGSPVENVRNKIRCNYCGKIINGGITRLKQHLAHQTGQVIACKEVPTEVKNEMKAILAGSKEKKTIQEDIRRQEVDACREEVFGTQDEEDSDPELVAAMRESLRTHGAAQRGGTYEVGGSSGAGGSRDSRGGLGASLRRAFSTRRARDGDDVQELPRPPSQRAHIAGPTDPYAHRRQSATQTGIRGAFSSMGKKAKEYAYRATGKFFLHNRIPPHVASSPYFQTMFDAVAAHGPGLKAPTPYDIGHTCVEEEYKETVDWVATFKQSWKERGCTIMCDGWTSINRRSLINFLVYSYAGTVFLKSVDATDKVKDSNYILSLMNEVVEEVGEEHVVQIVTDNEATYKAAGLKLMKTRKHLFWSPCAAHCLDLMIEEIGKRPKVAKVIERAKKITSFIYNHNWVIALMKRFTDGHELLRPGITRFATNFIALESLHKYRGGLQQMFISPEWQQSKYGRLRKGPVVDVVQIVQQNKFWDKVHEVLQVLEPLIKVLRLVDGDDKPTMGYMYEAMDLAKQSIQANCRYYRKYWEIIDKRWDHQLHHDLHAAGYFLNPQFRYATTCHTITDEVRIGLKQVIKTLLTDPIDQIDAITESQTTIWKLKFFVKGALELQAKNTESKADENLKRKKVICDALAKTAKKRNRKGSLI